jgi:hypothetical protein
MVLLDQRKGFYWHLNATGALTIRLLQDGCSPPQIASALAERFPGAADDTLRDVEALIEALQKARLLVTS